MRMRNLIDKMNIKNLLHVFENDFCFLLNKQIKQQKISNFKLKKVGDHICKCTIKHSNRSFIFWFYDYEETIIFDDEEYIVKPYSIIGYVKDTILKRAKKCYSIKEIVQQMKNCLEKDEYKIA